MMQLQNLPRIGCVLRVQIGKVVSTLCKFCCQTLHFISFPFDSLIPLPMSAKIHWQSQSLSDTTDIECNRVIELPICSLKLSCVSIFYTWTSLFGHAVTWLLCYDIKVVCFFDNIPCTIMFVCCVCPSCMHTRPCPPHDFNFFLAFSTTFYTFFFSWVSNRNNFFFALSNEFLFQPSISTKMGKISITASQLHFMASPKYSRICRHSPHLEFI